MVVLADDPMSAAYRHGFTHFRIEPNGAIAEFGDHVVRTLPGFEVYGNPRASPGSPSGANVLEYPSCSGEMSVDGAAESLIVLLDALQQSESEKGLEHQLSHDLLNVLHIPCSFEVDG
jgi:hypothetical protein